MRPYLHVGLLWLSCLTVCSAKEPTIAELLVGGEWDEEYIASGNRGVRGKWHYVFSEDGSFVGSRSDWTVDRLERRNLVTSQYKGKWTIETRRLSRQEQKASGLKPTKPLPVLTIKFENKRCNIHMKVLEALEATKRNFRCGSELRHSGHGPPLLFETMLFGLIMDQSCWRCSTWEEAERQHAEVVALVKSTDLHRAA